MIMLYFGHIVGFFRLEIKIAAATYFYSMWFLLYQFNNFNRFQFLISLNFINYQALGVWYFY